MLLALGLSVSPAEARVVRFVVEDRQPYAGGEQFGNSGSFERLIGTASMEVDPADPLNAIIVNLDKAPKNARGMVEFSAPFWIIKPVDMARGNRKMWYAINNRGNSELVPRANAAAVPATVALRLELGFSLVDAGWHGDGIPNPSQLFPTFPIATQPDGSPIVGPLRLEYLPTVDQFTRRLIVTPWKPYEAADTDTTHSTLTVRDRQDAPTTRIASDRWAFGVCPTGQASLVLTTTDLCLFDGFQANKMYELIYPAKDPIVMGLAHAVTRDVGSFLRYQTRDDLGNPNPLAASAAEVGIRRAYSSGVSSTGMYEREWIYLGFNEDEQHRKVFDGVTIYTAGAHRLFANVQFAHPTFYSRQDANQDYTSNAYPPFTFAVTTDPISGITDGILKRPATDPLVMQIDGGLEMWQWKASLNVVDGFGRPVPIPDNARLYLLAGSTHVGIGQGVLSAQLDAGAPGVCQYGTQRGAPFNATHRALVVAMDEWADQGIPAPKSNFPGLGKLVTLAEYRAIFPTIPAVQPTILMNELSFLFFGPNFDSTGGLEEVLPPEKLDGYQVFQTRIDNDGNPISGVGQMEVRVPLGTNMGWNVRVAPRAPDLCGLTGSYVPFAATRAERLANGDSRLSLEERYKSHAGFVMAVEKAAKHVVKERFMLPQDAQRYIEAAQASQVLGGAGN
ncbi:MAG TPA: alpha/beta hydrolase domain-containing protein [Myxococcaceae bacterium]|nr:alpha/beta hydrolase domain-containing protein [Myxococcaceae bacterium]